MSQPQVSISLETLFKGEKYKARPILVIPSVVERSALPLGLSKKSHKISMRLRLVEMTKRGMVEMTGMVLGMKEKAVFCRFYLVFCQHICTFAPQIYNKV
jgi:hypothetical protein